MKTETIIYPTLSKPKFVEKKNIFISIKTFLFLLCFRSSTIKTSIVTKPCPVSVETTPTRKTNEFELIRGKSISSDSISIVNSIDNFTPLASPLYSTAIAYSSPTDLHCRPNSNNSFLLAMVDHHEKQSFEII